MSLRKIRIDGAEYEGEDKLIDFYTSAVKELELIKSDSEGKLDSAEKSNTTLTAENDQLKEDNEKIKKEIETLKEDSKLDVEGQVQERLVLLDSANRAKVEVKADMSEKDIKRAIVLAVFPEAESKLDSGDETYLTARFDIALERLDEVSKENNDMDNKLKSDTVDKTNSKEKETKTDSKSAYENMIERNQNAHKMGKED